LSSVYFQIVFYFQSHGPIDTINEEKLNSNEYFIFYTSIYRSEIMSIIFLPFLDAGFSQDQGWNKIKLIVTLRMI
jgi:hypothetical protein